MIHHQPFELWWPGEPGPLGLGRPSSVSRSLKFRQIEIVKMIKVTLDSSNIWVRIYGHFQEKSLSEYYLVLGTW